MDITLESANKDIQTMIPKHGFLRMMVFLSMIILIIIPVYTYLNTFSGNSAKPFGVDGEWQLVFSDEFDGDELDSDKWVSCYWWGKNGCTNDSTDELQWYRADNIIVSDGTLKLRAQERTITASDDNTYDYSSGMVTTGRSTASTSIPPRFAFQYGYVEMRAKVPADYGLWSAFWMLPENHDSRPEIDIMELLGRESDVYRMNVHYIDQYGRDVDRGRNYTSTDFSDDWHVFAVNWQPDFISWYVDGIERWRFPGIEQTENVDMYLLINLAVGGDWAKNPDETSKFPSYFEIDYVRVWSGN